LGSFLGQQGAAATRLLLRRRRRRASIVARPRRPADGDDAILVGSVAREHD
jgi:hypothetical protein